MTRRSPSSSLSAASSAPLARATRSVIETLESRTMLAVTPPYVLEWTPEEVRIGVVDNAANGAVPTGFEFVNPGGPSPHTVDQYIPANLDVDTTTGVLKITTTGTATSGSNFEADNTLSNNVMNEFDALAGDFSITTRLTGNLASILTTANRQGGLVFGPNQDNFVKLVVGLNNTQTVIQFIDERGGTLHTIPQSGTYTNISLGGVTSIDLRMDGRINPDTGVATLQGFYKLNGAATWTKVTQEFTFNGSAKNTFFNATSRAGLMAMHKNSGGPITLAFDRFTIEAAPTIAGRPSVVAVRPDNGSTGAFRDAFVAADVTLPNDGGGIDPTTLNANTVRLIRTSDGAPVDVVLNTSGAGDAIVAQPRHLLDPNTQYTFQVTEGLKDLTGALFLPYSSSFTTGATTENPGDPNIAFEKVDLATATGETYSGLTFGPDGNLYASTLDGKIQRFTVNSDGTLGAPTLINTIRANNIVAITNPTGARLITGVVFDSAGAMWVSHSDATFPGSADYSGKITRLTGANYGTYTDFVKNLPRSYGDHTTNQMAFKPGTNKLYISQGAMNAMGAPDNGWANRPEHKLSAAILELDLSKMSANPATALDVKTENGGTYDPFNPANALTLYATGVRNAYDLVWHSNGKLYSASNGSASGGNIPATPSNLSTVPRRIDQTAPNNPAYTQAAPGITNNTITENDQLYTIQQGKYYGHPNPSRGEYIFNAGNNPNDAFTQDLALYPVGLNPDRNYAGPSYVFGQNYSPNGTIEYKGEAFGGALNGALMVVRYSGGDDVIILKLNAQGEVAETVTGVAGLSGFVDPLDLTQFNNPANPNDPRSGYLYVIEHGAHKITLARPISPGAKIASDEEKLLFSDPLGGAASATQTITIHNTGSSVLALPSDTLVLTGTDANQFTIVAKPTVPFTLAPGDSFQVKIAFNPTGAASTEGLKVAQLEIRSNAINLSNLKVDLRGLATTGSGGAEEPSLQRILDAHNIPVNVGDNDPTTTFLYEGAATGPTAASQEVLMPRLVKAGPGAVTIEALGAYAVAADVSVRLGYYRPGSPAEKTELATVRDGDSESISITLQGATAFDPGTGSFGLYGTFPGSPDVILFKNSDGGTTTTGVTAGGSPRDVYSEDQLNDWNTSSPHKVRFYPLRNPDGTIVPNAYIFAFEEFNSGFDSNDFVGIIRNVTAASAGAEIGVTNPDGGPQPNVISLNRLGTTVPDPYPDGTQPPDNKIHDRIKLRINNTGSAPLTVSSITAATFVNGSPATNVFAVENAPAFPAIIAAGSSIQVTVRLTATSGINHTGTLTINSNDTDEPTKVMTLKGLYQAKSEGNNERKTRAIVSAFDFSTIIAPNDNALNTGGTISAIGEEILSPYWRSADGGEVVVRQLAAFHTQGAQATLRWYNQAGAGTPGGTAAQGSPTNVFAKPNVTGTTSVGHLLTWTDNSNNETGFTIERSTNNFRTTEASRTVGAGITQYNWSGSGNTGTAGINYSFRVRANRPTGNSPYSNIVGGGNLITHNGLWGQSFFPARNPDDTLANGYQPVSYFQPDGAFGFRIDPEYSDDTLNDNSVDTGAAPTGHHMRFYPARDANGVAIPNTFIMMMDYAGINYDYNDNIYLVKNIAPATGVGAPVGVSAYGDPDAGVKIDWADSVDPAATGYNVYRALSAGGAFTKLNAAPLNSSDFIDSTAVVDTAYKYQIKTTGAGDAEGYETQVFATRPALPTLVTAAPANVTAIVQSSAQVKVNWNDVAGEHVYRVEFSTNGVTWAQAGIVQQGGTSLIVQDLDAGTQYQFRVFATNAAGDSPASNIATVTTDTATAPPIPANFQVTNVSETSVSVSWSNVTGETGYRIERSETAGSTYETIGTVAENTLTFTDSTVAAGTSYLYRVRSLNLNAPSAPSNTGSAVIPGGSITAPSFLNTTANSDTQISLSWQNVSAEELYKIERSPDGTNGWTEIGTRPANQTTFVDSPLTSATTYFYRVRAFSTAAGNTGYSPVASSTTRTVAPGQAVATADSPTQVTVTWGNVTGETGFSVQRSLDANNWAEVGTTSANDVDFVDTTVVAGTEYFYRVIASNAGGDSAPSAVGSVTTPTPPAPTEVILDNVSATYVGGWSTGTTTPGFFGGDYRHDSNGSKGSKSATFVTPVPNPSARYKVSLWYPARSDFASNVPVDIYTKTGIVTVTVNQRVNGNQWFDLPNDYEFDSAVGLKIVIRNGGTNGYVLADGVRFTQTTVTPPSAPAAPSNLQLAGVTVDSVSLSWTDNASNETGFRIARKGPGESVFTDLPGGTVSANVTVFTDTTVTAGTAYQYQVRALGATADSASTLPLSVTTTPAAPAILTPTALGARKINLTWSDVSGETGYLVEFSLAGQNNWSSVGTTGAGVTTIDHSSLTPNTAYDYRVFATGAGGQSAASNVASVSTSALPTTPTGITAVARGTGGVDVGWTDVANDAGYKVERSTDGVSWTVVASPATNAVTAFDNTTLPGTLYKYRVKSVNAFGDESVASVEQEVTTVATPAAPEVIVDNSNATYVAGWTISTNQPGFFSVNYRHDSNGSKGTKSATFLGTVDPSNPKYRVAFWYVARSDFASNTPVDIYTSTGITTVIVNQRVNGSQWFDLGEYQFDPAVGLKVVIRNGGTNGFVIADAFRFTPVAVAPPTAPTAPSDLQVTGVTTGSVSLSWTDNSSDELGFTVARRLAGSGSFVDLPGLVSGTTFTDSTVSPGTAYEYRVRAAGSSLDSAPTAAVTANTTPLAPAFDLVTAVGARRVDLRWGSVSGATGGYLLQVSPDGINDWADVTSSAAADVIYSHTGLSPQTTYHYRVIAVGASISSAPSAVSQAQTGALPTAPENVVAEAHAGGGVDITWTDSADDAGYKVERSINGVDWTVVATPATDATSAFDGSTAPATTYTYRVRSVNAFGDESAPSNTDDATTEVGGPTAPLAPTNFVVTTNSAFAISLSWTDNATDETSYLLQRSVDGGANWTDIALPADAQAYTDQGRSPNTTYSYRLAAVNGTGNSSFVALADPVTTPAAPTVTVDNVNATYVGGWSISTNSPGYFGVNYRHDSNGSKGTKSATFTTALPDPAGVYKVGFWYVARSDFATNTPVDIYTKTGIVTVVVNQRINGSQWFDLGNYEFDPAVGLKVVIRTTATNGFVVADAFQFTQIA